MFEDRELVELARRQHGLVTRDQLVRLGWTPGRITRRVRQGRWVRVAPSVYDVAPGSVDDRRALHAVVLSTGGWASHRSAGWLSGLIDDPPPCPEVVVATGHDRAAVHALVRRSTDVRRTHRIEIDGIRCTTVNRTLLDLAGVVPIEVLDDAMSRALSTGRTSIRRLDNLLARPLHGRRGAAALRRSLDQFRDRRHHVESRLEAIVNRAVAASDLPEPVRQFPVRIGSRVFRLDFAWPDERVFLEADGFAFHSSRRQFQADRERQNLLAVAGWAPLRCTWQMAEGGADLIVVQLRTMLGLPRLRRAG
jgi:very-short-patch-repair endonuclease